MNQYMNLQYVVGLLVLVKEIEDLIYAGCVSFAQESEQFVLKE
jgi:hypothetical protein